MGKNAQDWSALGELAKAAREDDAAWAKLVEVLYSVFPKLYTVRRRRINDRALTDVERHDWFTYLYLNRRRSLTGFEGHDGASYQTYLNKALKRSFLDWRRKDGGKQPTNLKASRSLSLKMEDGLLELPAEVQASYFLFHYPKHLPDSVVTWLAERNGLGSEAIREAIADALGKTRQGERNTALAELVEPAVDDNSRAAKLYFHRVKNAEATLETGVLGESPPPSEPASPSDDGLEGDRARSLQRALAKLSPLQRCAFLVAEAPRKLSRDDVAWMVEHSGLSESEVLAIVSNPDSSDVDYARALAPGSNDSVKARDRVSKARNHARNRLQALLRGYIED